MIDYYGAKLYGAGILLIIAFVLLGFSIYNLVSPVEPSVDKEPDFYVAQYNGTYFLINPKYQIVNSSTEQVDVFRWINDTRGIYGFTQGKYGIPYQGDM